MRERIFVPESKIQEEREVNEYVKQGIEMLKRISNSMNKI